MFQICFHFIQWQREEPADIRKIATVAIVSLCSYFH